MSDATIDHAGADHDVRAGRDEGHEHPSDWVYVKVALILAVITAIETLTYFESFIDFGSFIVPVLVVAMAIKFYMVGAYFMHLKFDNKVLRSVFAFGVVLAIAVYAVMLFAFNVITNDSWPS